MVPLLLAQPLARSLSIWPSPLPLSNRPMLLALPRRNTNEWPRPPVTRPLPVLLRLSVKPLSPRLSVMQWMHAYAPPSTVPLLRVLRLSCLWMTPTLMGTTSRTMPSSPMRYTSTIPFFVMRSPLHTKSVLVQNISALVLLVLDATSTFYANPSDTRPPAPAPPSTVASPFLFFSFGSSHKVPIDRVEEHSTLPMRDFYMVVMKLTPRTLVGDDVLGSRVATNVPVSCDYESMTLVCGG
jgi:hypothetical protein